MVGRRRRMRVVGGGKVLVGVAAHIQPPSFGTIRPALVSTFRQPPSVYQVGPSQLSLMEAKTSYP